MGGAVTSRDSQGLAPLALSVCSDKRLAGLAASGSRAAFAAIYERYQQRVYRYCASILRDPHDASDALQGTMLNLLQGMIDRGPPLELRPWLYRIAHNEAISILRRRRTGEGILDVSVSADQGPARDDVRERLAELLADIGELPENQRGALLMHEVDGLPYSAVAFALGSSPGAVKQSVYEARRTLHDYAAGRETGCESIRRTLSDHDRRSLRGHKLRAHLRACDACRDFKEAMVARRSELRALAPPLPAASAAILLQKILGGSLGGASGGSLGGWSASAGGVLGSAAAKPALVATLALGLGVGAASIPSKHERAGTVAGTPPSAEAPAASPNPRARSASASARERTARRPFVRLRPTPPRPRDGQPAGARPVSRGQNASPLPRKAPTPPPLPGPKPAAPPAPSPAAPPSGPGGAPERLAPAPFLEPLRRTAEGAILELGRLTHSTVGDANARLELSLGLRRPAP